ncbi:hypothetical protein [Arthrobacter sp. A5]|uniref:hypothetical protein n=1 Tax=Arthrobacter sp. A5 TaxID=576926 RepID=UPI003DA7D0FC
MHLSIGLMVLICADVICPGLRYLSRFAPACRGLTHEMGGVPSTVRRLPPCATDEPSQRRIDGMGRMRLFRNDIKARVTALIAGATATHFHDRLGGALGAPPSRDLGFD